MNRASDELSLEGETPPEQSEQVGNYFVQPKTKLEFISSGCTVFDCALGGGWPLGRISNILGDKASGKTLLAIEACANFNIKYRKGNIYYRESEAAFDTDYARALGMPVDKVDFGDGDFFTVEDLFEDLNKVLANLPAETPALYIIDSLDALSDRDEVARDIDKGSYGANKAKVMSQLFRRTVKMVEKKRLHLMFLSQIRDNLTAALFGKKTTRSGGRALDFYCSQIVSLARTKTLTRSIRGVERATGIEVKAHLDKNKISLPYREAEFTISFGYGIDDLKASLDWLVDVKSLTKDQKEAKEKELARVDDDTFLAAIQEISQQVDTRWREIEMSFMPQRTKYIQRS